MIRLQRGAASSAQLRWRLFSSARQAPAPKLARTPRAPAAAVELKTPYPKQPVTPPPPPPPQQGETVLDHWRSSWLPLTGAAVLAGLLGFYIFGTAAASLRAGPAPCQCGGEHSIPTGRPPALTGDNAEQFDKELNLPEWLMGITSLRRRIAQRAEGDVLELAMGSGRNLEYYNWNTLASAASAAFVSSSSNSRSSNDGDGGDEGSGATRTHGIGVTSFTGLDISADMLDVARRKLTKAVPPLASSSYSPVVRSSTMPDHSGGQLSYLDGHLRLITSDAHKPLPPPRSSPKYDTVIQTFGLCSVSDPVAVLANLASAVKPGTGRIFLLEHGKGWFGIVNGLLDRNAGKHFEKYGCWWNRDIQALAEEAARTTPGLEVVAVERPSILQMGTLVWVELRVTNGHEME